METISGRIINVSSNKRERTFTIRTGEGLKYRTSKFNKQEFESTRHNWTGNDWQNYLRTSEDYYLIK
jgi:hypothetical protein